MAEKEQKGNQAVENIEVASDRTKDFFEKNQSLIIGLVVAIVVLVGGYFGVKYLYIAPKEKTASTEMFYAQRYFELDSINYALNGDGEHAGFLEIADGYKITKSGKLAGYYAGLIYLHQGRAEDALPYLRKFSTSDPLLFILSNQALGDAYLETGALDKALAAYKKGAGKYTNEVFTPTILMRVALTCEMKGDYNQALSVYTRIRDEYPRSQEGQDMERQIARMNAKLGK